MNQQQFHRMKKWSRLTLVLVVASFAVGCAGLSGSKTTAIKLTGTAGVTAQVKIMSGGVQVSDARLSVPSTVELPAGDLDVLCIQQGKAGAMQVVVVRRGTALGSGQTAEPGSVVEIGVRGENVSIGTKSRQAAESLNLK